MTLPPKAPPPPLAARAARPMAVRLRGSAVKIVGAAAALVLSGAFIWAFVLDPAGKGEARDGRATAQPAGTVRPSEVISGQPAAYDGLAANLPPPRTMTAPPTAPDPATRRTAVAPGPVRRPDPSPALQAAAAARASDVFFAGPAERTPSGARPPTAPGIVATPGASGLSQAERADYAAAYARHRLLAPLSPFEVKAGTMIPAALLTAVDTGRPGPVVAVTTEPVFDTVTGRILLLPQGSRLLGVQTGDSTYGERRAYVTWKRIILPNGKSLLLDDEAATDGAGRAGAPGRTDRRLLQVAGAVLLSGAISTVGEIARGGRQRGRGSISDAFGDAAAGQAVELGGRFLGRELEVRPRVLVGAGAAVGVLLTRDLILEPAT